MTTDYINDLPTMQIIDELLLCIAKKLDITEFQYQAVIERYTDVALHLAQQNSILFPFKPDIKPQGSFLLGTMIQPAIGANDLDVDLVCRLHGKKLEWTQENIKEAVGKQLKLYESNECKLAREGNRCWTLVYNDDTGFHMDILPAIISQNHFTVLEKSFNSYDLFQTEQTALRITDKRRNDYCTQTEPLHWLKSNPFGYAIWFKERASLTASKSFSLQDMIEPLPIYEPDKEPLIRVIQILKRHRDIMFAGDPCKPASIIITTLAAKCYRKETGLLLMLNNILAEMEFFVEGRFCNEQQRTIKWISNPVNDHENFADGWLCGDEGGRKEYQFYRWIKKVRMDFSRLYHVDLSDACVLCEKLLGIDITPTANYLLNRQR